MFLHQIGAAPDSIESEYKSKIIFYEENRIHDDSLIIEYLLQRYGHLPKVSHDTILQINQCYFDSLGTKIRTGFWVIPTNYAPRLDRNYTTGYYLKGKKDGLWIIFLQYSGYPIVATKIEYYENDDLISSSFVDYPILKYIKMFLKYYKY